MKIEMPSNCRTKYCPAVVALHRRVDGLTNSEIAHMTGYPIGAVTNIINRRYPSLKAYVRDWRGIKSIEAEYLNGATTYELGEKYGVDHGTISRWMRKIGHHRGKGSNTNGVLAYVKNCEARRVERFAQISDKVSYISGRIDNALVRCQTCGAEFMWRKEYWKMDCPCPACRARDKHRAAERRAAERKQQKRLWRTAAKEWRLSVPRVCNECGDPFYSEHPVAFYCSDACRLKAKKDRKKARMKARAIRPNKYRRRMRIPRTDDTYDRTVTLDAVYKKYRGKCCNCGVKTVRSKEYSPTRATLDHIVALANNGTHTWDNVQLLCADCNSHKRDLGQMRLAI